MSGAVLEIDRLRKHGGTLRQVRIAQFRLEPGERVAIVGPDAQAAEILVNLVTGATLPDQGEIRVFGRATAAITDADDWLATLDRFGMVSSRAVLLDGLSLAQNIAMAFSLSIDPIADGVMAAVRRLSVEVGVSADDLDTRLADLPVATKTRCHLARALAANPAVLMLEHANALLSPGEHPGFAKTISRVVRRRRMAVFALTTDERFARAVAGRVLKLDRASGVLLDVSGWRRWLGR